MRVKKYDDWMLVQYSQTYDLLISSNRNQGGVLTNKMTVKLGLRKKKNKKNTFYTGYKNTSMIPSFITVPSFIRTKIQGNNNNHRNDLGSLSMHVVDLSSTMGSVKSGQVR